MRTGLLLAFFLAFTLCAILIGQRLQKHAAPATAAVVVPSIGRVQILNACGQDGAGGRMADFLRRHNFDVKNITNAPTSNYEQTLVVSRQADMRCARQVGACLKSDKIVLLRTGEDLYDVTIFVGADYKERTQ
ncbi:MAG: LytR C-terminal domain-containing protein [Chitinivibrionales bacterium]|nr:LytR C-terminal domain-containing protein [Chitinivibrionales bacterium]